MKFSLASDVHLEHGYMDLNNEEGSDVLVLAGDIFVAKHFKNGSVLATDYRRFLENVTKSYSHVVYIMGNHEHYGGDFATTSAILNEEFQYFNNFKFLEKSFVDICDVRFVGGTLWTDANKMNPVTALSISNLLNDYVVIKDSSSHVTYRVYDEEDRVSFRQKTSTFSVETAYADHKKCLDAISIGIDTAPEDKKIVVVTHHLPTYESIDMKYRKEWLIHENAGFASDLSEYILDRERIEYWIHGHTHSSCDYMTGKTRVICNPRGYYGKESRASKFTVRQYAI